LVGAPAKSAFGTRAPAPVTRLVLVPSEGTLNVTRLVKVPTPAGVKPNTRFVAEKPGRVKGEPERMENGPELTEAVPLLSVTPPWLVRIKLAWAFEPTTTAPKSSVRGKIAN